MSFFVSEACQFDKFNLLIRRRLGGAERNPTDDQDVGFGKASTQQSNFFPIILAMTGYYKTTEIFSEIKYDSYSSKVAV
jgi:hypothetical protein